MTKFKVMSNKENINIYMEQYTHDIKYLFEVL